MGSGGSEVAGALARLRDRLREPLFPLDVAGAKEARRTWQIACQVDDYVLPRLVRPDAPLLACTEFCRELTVARGS